MLGREVGVSQAAVAAWENCVNEPPSEMVFKLEQKLALRPGALSSHLGYLPLSVTASRAKPDTIEAILRDSHLGEVEKKAMLGLYRSLAPRAR